MSLSEFDVTMLNTLYTVYGGCDNNPQDTVVEIQDVSLK